MPNKKASTTVTMIPGNLHLTRRNDSTIWQAHYRVDGKWFRASTKKSIEEEARETALELMMETKFRQKLGFPVVTRRFRNVAELTKKALQDEESAGRGKVIYKHYIGVIDNYLIPFFGNHNIDTIDYSMLTEFNEWRRKRFGKEPAASTINTHNAALNRVFDEAVSRAFLTQSKVPTLTNRGKGSERRPTFTLDEYRHLYRFMRHWVKQGRDGKPRMMRRLLRDYVLILANSGARHGTEMENLRWNHLMIRDGYLVMSVEGKTARREAIPRSGVIRYFKRIAKRDSELGKLPFEEVIKTNKKVFRLENGTETKSLHQTFEKLMIDSGLLVDPITEQNRTLYSMRHFYITQKIMKGNVSLHVIAKNCGTSIPMLEKHYSHLVAWDKRKELVE